jgi:hypothetical protein
MVRALFVSICLFAVVGCGSSRPATTDCDDFVENVLCPRAVYCGGDYTSLNDCIGYFETQVFDCPTVDENPGLGACEDDIDNDTCSYLVPNGTFVPPNSCTDVFVP